MRKWRYKARNCPICDIEHHHRGPFCSQKCYAVHKREIMLGGKVPERTKEKISVTMKEYRKTPHGMNPHIFITGAKAEDFYIEIPEVDQEIPEGYEKGEKW